MTEQDRTTSTHQDPAQTVSTEAPGPADSTAPDGSQMVGTPADSTAATEQPDAEPEGDTES
jgi:hypothetical protein